MPGLRERKKEQTRQTIRAAALRLFAEDGFDATTISEIARAANVSEGTVFNYFPTKEDLIFSGMEESESALLKAIRERQPGETVLTAFRRYILEPRGLLASQDPEASKRLATVSRIIVTSPALVARENQIVAHNTHALAALIAKETRTSTNDVTPWIAANALMGVHRALLDQLRKRIVSTPTQASRIARGIRTQADHALTLLEHGLNDYAKRH